MNQLSVSRLAAVALAAVIAGMVLGVIYQAPPPLPERSPMKVDK